MISETALNLNVELCVLEEIFSAVKNTFFISYFLQSEREKFLLNLLFAIALSL